MHRFRDIVKAGQQSKLTVKEEMVQHQGYGIVDLDLPQIVFYSKSGALPKAVQEALAKAAAMKQAMSATQRQLEDHQNRLNQITAEQNRIRDNMRTVDQKSQYYARLLAKLNEQESQIEKLQGDVEALRATFERQDNELRAYLGGLRLE